MIRIPERPFDKITIDLIMECETSTSGNRHILTMHMVTSHSVQHHVIWISQKQNQIFLVEREAFTSFQTWLPQV